MRVTEGNEEVIMEGDSNEDRIEIVKREKRLLKSSDETEIKDGVDYAHFNFMMSAYFDDFNACMEDETKSAGHLLELFWDKFFPYLKAEILDKQAVLMKLDETAKDADKTVELGFDMKFELDHAKILLGKHGLTKAYNVRLKVQREQLKKNIDKLREDGVIK
jgi:hypothetical protein